MADSGEIANKITVVEFALASFAYHKNEREREAYLEKNFEHFPSLRTYLGYTMEQLKDEKKQLQEKENVLLTQNKGTTAKKGKQVAQQVYQWLMDAKEHDGVLRLPDGGAFPVVFTSDDDITIAKNVVLVRDFSKHLCEMVDWIREKREVDGMTQRGLIVRGPPGDGKSFTSQYLIWHCVKKRVTVVYESIYEDSVWVFRSDGDCRQFIGAANQETVPELLEKNTVFIHDTKANATREPVGGGRATLVVISPISDQLVKQTERDRMITIGFVTPTTEEVYRANLVFGVKMTLSKLINKIKKYGCHLRWLFDKKDAQIEGTLQLAISKLLNSKSLDNVLTGAGIGAEAAGESSPTVLFSTALKPELKNAFDAIEKSLTEAQTDTSEKRMAAMFEMYRPSNIMWSVVSEHVSALIVEKAWNKGDEFKDQLINAMSNVPQLSATLAPIVEGHVPAVLSRGGKFRCRVLNEWGTRKAMKQEETCIDVPKTTLENVVGKFTDVQAAIEHCTKSGVLYNICGHFLGVDAFLRPVDTTKPTDFFNFTGAIGHPLHFAAVAALHKHFANGDVGTFFNFVVPDRKFDSWTNEQSFVVETAIVELKQGAVSLWRGTFMGGSSVAVTSSLPEAERPVVTLTGSQVKITYQGHTIEKSKQDLAKNSVKLRTASLHFTLNRRKIASAALPEDLKREVSGMKQRVISHVSLYPNSKKGGSMREFSTVATRHHNLHHSSHQMSQMFVWLPRVLQFSRRVFAVVK